jgi:Tol biopolymer transport system component
VVETTSPTSTPAPINFGSQSIAWISQPSNGKPEIWASIRGAAPRRITQAVGDDCSTSALGPPVISPDGKHIAVVGGVGCGDGQAHGTVFLVNVATGSFHVIPNSDALTNARSVGWLGNGALWIAGSSTSTLGVDGIHVMKVAGVDAVVRGNSIFYLSTSGNFDSGLSATLHRYSLSAHHDLNTFNLGSFELSKDHSPGDFHFQGWDASPDGSHVVYQVTTPGPAGDSQLEGISNSHIFYANADGSNATPVLQFMTTNGTVRIRFSPDGTQVAVTEAEPLPDIITGCANSSGTSDDPCFHSYTLPAGQQSSDYPAWAADGDAFLVESNSNLYRFTVGTPAGVLVRLNATNPWTL